MTTDHYGNAIAHIEAVKATRESLRQLYREPMPSSRDAARLNHDLGDALKLAEVEATLYVGNRLDALVRTIDAQRLTADEVDQLLLDGTRAVS